MSKRYTVTSIQTADGPTYVIHDAVNDAYVGFFDTQKWAESIAGVMESEWEEKNETKGGKGQESNVREER